VAVKDRLIQQMISCRVPYRDCPYKTGGCKDRLLNQQMISWRVHVETVPIRQVVVKDRLIQQMISCRVPYRDCPYKTGGCKRQVTSSDDQLKSIIYMQLYYEFSHIRQVTVKCRLLLC
jgi:hypothetical protein